MQPKRKVERAADADTEEDLRAANDRMNKGLPLHTTNSVNSKATTRVTKKKPAKKEELYEERKTTVKSTAKNIYKPFFNLPAKEKVQEQPRKAKEKNVDTGLHRDGNNELTRSVTSIRN